MSSKQHKSAILIQKHVRRYLIHELYLLFRLSEKYFRKSKQCLRKALYQYRYNESKQQNVLGFYQLLLESVAINYRKKFYRNTLSETLSYRYWQIMYSMIVNHTVFQHRLKYSLPEECPLDQASGTCILRCEDICERMGEWIITSSK